MVGRPRKSIADHIADKTYRPSRHDSRSKQRSDGQADELVAPADFSDIENLMWLRIVTAMPEYLDSRLDAANLEGLCRWFGIWRRSVQKAAEVGPDESYKHVMQAATAWKQFTVLADTFGLSPKARDRLDLVFVPDGEAEENPLAKWGVEG